MTCVKVLPQPFYGATEEYHKGHGVTSLWAGNKTQELPNMKLQTIIVFIELALCFPAKA